MTRDEFITELTCCASKVQWHLNGDDKKIRALQKVGIGFVLHCPISWVAYCKGADIADIDHPDTSASCIDLQSWDAIDIVMAADGEEDEVAIREMLLRAVKLLPQA